MRSTEIVALVVAKVPVADSEHFEHLPADPIQNYGNLQIYLDGHSLQ